MSELNTKTMLKDILQTPLGEPIVFWVEPKTGMRIVMRIRVELTRVKKMLTGRGSKYRSFKLHSVVTTEKNDNGIFMDKIEIICRDPHHRIRRDLNELELLMERDATDEVQPE